MIKEYIVSITDDVDPNGFKQFENDYSPEQELVRCRDCKWYDFYLFGCTNSKSVCFHRAQNDPDWFCADGERRDDL